MDRVTYNAAQRRHYLKKRAVVCALKDRPCADCGVRHPWYVMTFDHLDPRTKSFVIGSRLCQKGTKTLLAEIAKCEVVCANCHAERTYQRRVNLG